MLGAIIGDIVGSIYEFQNTKSMDFDMITPWSNFTDDSVMTLAVAKWLVEDEAHTIHYLRRIADIRPTYDFDVSCQGSVPEAIIAFLEGNSFEEVIRLAISLGGDSDTIGAMAGAIAACCYEIPQYISDKCHAILTEDLREIQNEFEKLIETRTKDDRQYL